MLVLVINCGSSSVKYNLIETSEERNLCKGLIERIGAVTSIVKHEPAEGRHSKDTRVIANHTEALQEIMDYLMSPDNEIIQSPSDIKAVGHRVVHGGSVALGVACRNTAREMPNRFPCRFWQNFFTADGYIFAAY